MAIKIRRQSESGNAVTAAARKDFVTGAVIIASLAMLGGTGSTLVKSAVTGLETFGGDSDRALIIALMLNIALSLFSWRRYRDSLQASEERSAAEERAVSLSLIDPVTGTLNRRALAEQGAGLLATALRREKGVVMIVFDVDNFKTVNDVHGHAAGDALLRKIATETETLLPQGSLLARIGGDEFACSFIFELANRDVVDRVVEAILVRMAQPIEVHGTNLTNHSVTIGIAASALDCTTVESLLRRADIAMYAARHNGRNRSAWFDSSMERELLRRNDLESAMRVGITTGEFVPYFEQQVDMTTGLVCGFEMLARWNHPTKGVIVPDVFIPIAEESGLIADLSIAVMRVAFEEACHWDPALTLAVNISPMQLKDPWFAQKLVKLLSETGFPPSRLEVEITETSLYDNLALAQSIVGSLKNQGIRLALDDFGTGYSSLAHLRALPFDKIKIDKSFVTSIIDNTESAAIVNAITKLGDSLGLTVIAEGVEDKFIVERLREIGCHLAQGWEFGRPLSAAQTRTMLAERSLLVAPRRTVFNPDADIADSAKDPMIRRSA